ncbi:MAG: ABC transporter ATP-binding protein [Caldilineaceae bacterium]
MSQLPHLVRTLKMVWQIARGWTVAWVVLLILQGLLPVATVYLTRTLVDSLVVALQKEAVWSSFQPLLPLVIFMALAMLLTELSGSAASYVRTVQAELVRDHISDLIHAQSVAVDLAYYDLPEYYDRLYRAQYHSLDRPLVLLENIGTLFQSMLTLLGMMAVLLPYGIWLPIVLLISTFPTFYVVLEHRLRLHFWQLRNTETERRAWYYSWLLTDRESAAELRIFDLGTYFQKLYQTVRTKLRSELIQLEWSQRMAEGFGALIALLVTGAALAWMLWRAVLGALTLGDLALFYQAFQQGQRVLGSLLENLGGIYSNTLFLSDLYAFLSLEPTVKDPVKPTPIPLSIQHGICFENITFHYPRSQRVALTNFSLSIPAKKIVAIVGTNGAGKSTLVKLLCRFYDPDAGRILLDGVDLRQFKLSELRRQITILFQEPVQYQNTVLENITLGDLAHPNEQSDVERAASASGADGPIGRLPQRYETLLGNWFKGGTELSVGEWQRLALARAYWRLAPILVLDEPTSAMDPWAEHDWLQRFRKLAEGRTALIITHRFTTAMYADTIHVMENGQVVESGSHMELLALHGRYATSWHEQMQNIGAR